MGRESADLEQCPPIAGTLLSKLGPVALSTWVELDVTAAIQGDGTYSFGMLSTSSDNANYNSKEAAANRPELVIDIAATSTATPMP